MHRGGDTLEILAKALGRDITLSQHLVKNFLVFTFQENKTHLIHEIAAPKINGEIRDNIRTNKASIAVLVLPSEWLSTDLNLFGCACHSGNGMGRRGERPLRGPIKRRKAGGVGSSVKEAVEKLSLDGKGEDRGGAFLANGFYPIDIGGTRMSRASRVRQSREINGQG